MKQKNQKPKLKAGDKVTRISDKENTVGTIALLFDDVAQVTWENTAGKKFMKTKTVVPLNKLQLLPPPPPPPPPNPTINEIKFPLPEKDFKEWLLLGFECVPGMFSNVYAAVITYEKVMASNELMKEKK